jgi:acyl-homoserine lactone synthase
MIIEEKLAGPWQENAALRGMFEARKRVFVDLLKWDLPVVADRFEIDRFDDIHARYLIVAKEGGAHLGSARLLPTHRPHILGSLFPDLCAGEVPAGPGIFEITRFCLDRNQGALERRLTRNRLVSALVTHALQTGIHTYTGVAEMSWLSQILAFGWRCRPLGIPKRSVSGMLGALLIEIDDDTPALLAANGIWSGEELADLPALEAA